MSQDTSAATAMTVQVAPRWTLGRLAIPLGILLLATAVIAYAQFAGAMEKLPPAETFLFTSSSIGAAVILLALWFVFLAPISRAVRLRTGTVLFLLLAMFVACFRVESVSGNIVPKLSFRWSRPADTALDQFPSGLIGRPADLKTTTPADYPEFLGRDRRATLAGLKLARDWSARPPKRLWRQPIGAGWSGFAVVGPFAVTQEQRGADEVVTCYERDTGRLRWAHADRVRFDEVIAGTGPRATPTIVDGVVYTLGAMGLLNCLDGATGNMLWQNDVVKQAGGTVPQWGKSCSPLIMGGVVVVSAGGPDGKSLVAYDRQTGNLVWSAGNDRSAYSSPVLAELDGQPQILIVNDASLAAHDPRDGHILWQHERPTGSPNVSQPVVIDRNHLFVSKGYGVGCELWEVKRSLDGEWTVDVQWKNQNLKTKFCNVVVRDGYVYGLDEGVLVCLDLKTGERKWKNGHFGHGQILLVDDLILVQAESGNVALVEATPDGFHELSHFAAIEGKTWNNPVLAGNRLLVRNGEQAACYQLPLADDAPSASAVNDGGAEK